MAKRELTKAQKEWVKERDGYRCQFHTYFHSKGLVRCPNTTKLEVHHIKPWRFLMAKHGHVEEVAGNLVTLCRTHHIGHIHPDMDKAIKAYHKDKSAIGRVFDKRDEAVAKGIPYWVTRWDSFLKFIATEATLAFVKKKPWPK